MTPIEKLSSINFLSIADVAMDILERSQMTTIVTFPLLRKILLGKPFNILMPGDDADSGSSYCNYRLKAIEYLKANNYIIDFEISEEDYIFERNAKITINKERFIKFFDKLKKIYQKRVVDPALKEQEKKENHFKSNKSNIDYEYNENGKKGILIINSCPKIEFSKIPALIVKYFFDSKDLDNNYKSYHDFKTTYFINNLTSDYFSKRIISINKRIGKHTKDKIKQIISKDDKETITEINRYKWKIMM